jgi:DNA polymerase-4
MSPPQGLGWLYVDFNSYFASVEQQLDPRLRGRPVAVIPVETESTCAIAASYEAKAFGIRTGTPVHEARKLCPDLICVLGRHEHYVEFHERILDEIDRHIPISQVCSIDEMACRLMRNEAAVARVTEIAAAIKSGIARNIGEYVRCSIGVASNKYLAKVATDLQKPDGFTVLQPDNMQERLLTLSLRDLPGIGANMERRLNDAGIRDMAALLSLQPKHMRAVWGSIWGEKMWYYLRGYDLPDEKTETGSIGHSHVLSPELRPPAAAHQVARRLTAKAAARMRRMGYFAGKFTLSVRLENGPGLAAEAAFDPAQDSFIFLKWTDDLWADVMREVGPRRRIKKVSVVMHGLKKPEDLTVQGDLFAAAAKAEGPSKGDKISRAVDELNQKFGRDTVTFGMTAKQSRSTFTGTKIAFTRIPDMEEFSE